MVNVGVGSRVTLVEVREQEVEKVVEVVNEVTSEVDRGTEVEVNE